MEGMGLSDLRTRLAGLCGKQIFLTGHTGFKGSWMSTLLARLGAEVHGFALPATGSPNLASMADIRQMLASETLADIRDEDTLRDAMTAVKPDLIIHMAAQALVRQSYADPLETWSTNVIGTASVLEAARSIQGLRGIVVVTTDKCYENQGWEWGYREIDPLGGHDPYSASKAATELVAQSYRRSFFHEGSTLLATARAGNVIGGGDWSTDRLLADAARAATNDTALVIRNPAATRPWQHVLDCLSGYLTLGQALLDGNSAAASAFNFGPSSADNVSVAQVLEGLVRHWPELRWETEPSSSVSHMHEASFLYLDSSRARQTLGWQPRWTLELALEKTALWYRSVQVDPDVALGLMTSQIDEYIQ